LCTNDDYSHYAVFIFCHHLSTKYCIIVAESPALHVALKPLEWLLGCWKTTDGFGHYPTIKDFRYVEQIEFSHVGQPNLQFTQVNLLCYESALLLSNYRSTVIHIIK